MKVKVHCSGNLISKHFTLGNCTHTHRDTYFLIAPYRIRSLQVRIASSTDGVVPCNNFLQLEEQTLRCPEVYNNK